MHLTDEVSMLLEQVVEGAFPERDLDGPRRAASESRIEPRLGEGFLEQCEIGPGPPAGAGLGGRTPDQVLAPRPGLVPGSVALPLAGEEPGEDVGQ